MGNLDNFLSSLSDHELAIFKGFRYHSFLQNSKEKITIEIKRRNLSSETLENFFGEKLNIDTKDKSVCCSLCGSDKLFIESNFEEKPISEFSSVEVAIDSVRCRLCGFNPSKTTPKSFTERLKKLFQKNRSRRIVKWNEL